MVTSAHTRAHHHARKSTSDLSAQPTLVVQAAGATDTSTVTTVSVRIATMRNGEGTVATVNQWLPAAPAIVSVFR